MCTIILRLSLAGLFGFILVSIGSLEQVFAQSPKPGIGTPQMQITNSIGMKLALVPAGTFQMGSPLRDRSAQADERPQHEVRISRAFYLGVCEVTQAEYQAVMGNNPSTFTVAQLLAREPKLKLEDTLSHPVETVSWLDAIKFCNELSRREGLAEFYSIKGQFVAVIDWDGVGYRLPTEAEWEYACRAGSKTRYSCGDDSNQLLEIAWVDKNSGMHTHAVGEKPANAFGLHDMDGNVSEWCWDQPSRYNSLPQSDPRGSYDGSGRVYRGGSWVMTPHISSCAFRFWGPPSSRRTNIGLRVAASGTNRTR